MKRRVLPLLAAVLFAVAACATTVRDDAAVEPTWRSREAPAAPAAASGERLTAYVASFGLSEKVAERHPELLEARAGLGISQRIADALYDSGRFRFVEEKAEMAARIADFRARSGDADAPAEARWLLYGELVEVRTARDERVTGLAGRAETTTMVTVQIRLVDREGSRFLPATATGSATSAPARGRVREEGVALDPEALAAATGEAVRAAAAQLLVNLEGE
ncbi:MAG TPA: hypothetical protein VMR44_02845 [Thermoanaerobaculia bacterium]|nr:hypothetical protein [Thermoanaerobaculia bacterium]